ncbi:MAG TPA: phosphatase PAP2 family protein [Acidimicrobiales bacterium]|nr:phosphatase PAP2 family protein [Acidimicrobiales bacterium]
MAAGAREPGSRSVAVTALVLVAGLLILVLSALPVDRARVSDVEVDAFRAVNDGPDVPFALVWLPMQAGNVLAPAVAASAALAVRRPRLAAALVACGLAAWVLGKVVKQFVERGRPDALVEDVVLRGAAAQGLGFVSGHVAVIVAVAVVTWPYLGRGGRTAVSLLAALVALLRVYVGAHLPLDVVGGAGLGLAAGSAVALVAGRPRRRADDR